MKVTLKQDRALRFVATNERAQETAFDTTEAGGGLNSAASQMDILLEAAGACTSMDVVSILTKKRRTLSSYTVELEGERASEHPKVFTKIHMAFFVTSSDATMRDITAAIELSHSKYCSVSIMLSKSGCDISWSVQLSNGNATEYAASSDQVLA